MVPDRLYDLAVAFRKTRLWDELCDSQLFAVRQADGGIDYCCVMGLLGEHLALAVYPGAEGFAGYQLLAEGPVARNPYEDKENAFMQDCLMCSFATRDELSPKELEEAREYAKKKGISFRGKYAFPRFQRFRPRRFPWYLDDPAEQDRLAECLEACLEVAGKLREQNPGQLGLNEGRHYRRRIPLLQKKDGAFVWGKTTLPDLHREALPSPALKDDLIPHRTRGAKRTGAWACDIVMHPEAVSEEAGEEGIEEPLTAPSFPFMILLMDQASGMVLGHHLTTTLDEYPEAFLKTFQGLIRNQGKPSEILVPGPRPAAFFRDIAQRLDIPLRQEGNIPLLEEALESLWDRMEEGGEKGEGDGTDPKQDRMLRDIVAFASDAGNLRTLPWAVLEQIVRLAEGGLLPEAAAGNVMKEARRRKK